MNKKFYIIRHGDKVREPGDTSLSEQGIEQAKATGKHFLNRPKPRIVASPLRRTKQTAEIIAETLETNFETDPLLKERANWGDDPEQSLRDFLHMWEKASRERSWQPPVGDSSVDSGKRLNKAIKQLSADKQTNFVLVTHGGILTDYLRNKFSNQELRKFIRNTDMTFDNTIKECSITTIKVTGLNNKPELISLATTDHLPENQ